MATISFITGFIYSCFMLFSTFYFHAHHNSIFIVYLPTIFAKRFYNEAFMTWFMYYTALCLDVWTFNNSTIKCDFFLYITKLTQYVQYVLLELNEKSWSLNIFIKFRHFFFCWLLSSLAEWRTKDWNILWNTGVCIKCKICHFYGSHLSLLALFFVFEFTQSFEV